MLLAADLLLCPAVACVKTTVAVLCVSAHTESLGGLFPGLPLGRAVFCRKNYTGPQEFDC